MQRDMNLIRQILFAVDASEEDPRGWVTLEMPGSSVKEVSYHVMLLGQAGLLDVQDASAMGENGFQYYPKSLTWDGHDLLDAIRDEGIWSRVREKLKAVGGTTTLELLKAIAVAVAKEQLGIGTV